MEICLPLLSSMALLWPREMPYCLQFLDKVNSFHQWTTPEVIIPNVNVDFHHSKPEVIGKVLHHCPMPACHLAVPEVWYLQPELVVSPQQVIKSLISFLICTLQMHLNF